MYVLDRFHYEVKRSGVILMPKKGKMKLFLQNFSSSKFSALSKLSINSLVGRWMEAAMILGIDSPIANAKSAKYG